MTAALGIMCKAPRPGLTKTRLAARLGSEKAARLSACFLADVAGVVLAVPEALAGRDTASMRPRDRRPSSLPSCRTPSACCFKKDPISGSFSEQPCVVC